jgi:hypothetical protein
MAEETAQQLPEYVGLDGAGASRGAASRAARHRRGRSRGCFRRQPPSAATADTGSDPSDAPPTRSGPRIAPSPAPAGPDAGRGEAAGAEVTDSIGRAARLRQHLSERHVRQALQPRPGQRESAHRLVGAGQPRMDVAGGEPNTVVGVDPGAGRGGRGSGLSCHAGALPARGSATPGGGDQPSTVRTTRTRSRTLTGSVTAAASVVTRQAQGWQACRRPGRAPR